MRGKHTCQGAAVADKKELTHRMCTFTEKPVSDNFSIPLLVIAALIGKSQEQLLETSLCA